MLQTKAGDSHVGVKQGSFFLGQRRGLDGQVAALQIRSTTPAQEAVQDGNLASDSAVTVFPSASLRTGFDKALKAGGQNVEFVLEGPGGKVPGYLSWVRGDEDGNTIGSTALTTGLGQNSYDSGGRYLGYRGLRFRPLQPLAAETAYRATVSEVENLAGVPLEEPYGWGFSTGPGAGVQSTLPPRVRKYYFFGSQRVAQRQIDEFGADVLYWLAGDHRSAELAPKPGHDQPGAEQQWRGGGREPPLPLRRGALEQWHVTNGLSLHRSAGRRLH
jgi:hypothetical protein